MFHRLYPKPFTRLNESWNPMGRFNSCPSASYCNPIITGKSNQFQFGETYCDFYDSVAIDIVTETVFDYPGAQITEKTLRPILNKRPFIIVGAAGTLEYLRTKGIKTFGTFIDEDYDTIKDPIKRMQFLCSEITRIAVMPVDKIRDFVLEYTPVLDHNFNILKDLETQELAEVSDRLSKL